MLIFLLCFLISLLPLIPLYKYAFKVAKSLNKEFSAGIQSEKGFTNGAGGNAIAGGLYVFMLPFALNLFIAFIAYLIFR